METAIEVQHVSKVYQLYNKASDRLLESIHPFRKKYHSEFYAVKDLNFTVKKNEAIGIIGKNGSGKSTLLKMITGVLTPTSGNIAVHGNISALLELGAGFNPQLTGLENIYLNGTIRGQSKEAVEGKMDEILSFADIGQFIHQPVKTYSSGMFVRLAFAVAISNEPEILIVDEALSVGDMRFQQKCFRRIESFTENGTVLFVSHDLNVLNKFCNRVLWINEGELVDEGEPLQIAKKYQAFMLGSKITKSSQQAKTLSGGPQRNNTDSRVIEIDEISNNLDILGDNKIVITGISLFDGLTSQKTQIFEPEQLLQIAIRFKCNDDIENLIVGFSIKDRLGNVVMQSNSYVIGESAGNGVQNEELTYAFQFKLPYLNGGEYTISPAIASGTQEVHTQHSWIHDAILFQIVNKQPYRLQGYLVLDSKHVEFQQIT